jgi:hypothetical protein
VFADPERQLLAQINGAAFLDQSQRPCRALGDELAAAVQETQREGLVVDGQLQAAGTQRPARIRLRGGELARRRLHREPRAPLPPPLVVAHDHTKHVVERRRDAYREDVTVKACRAFVFPAARHVENRGVRTQLGAVHTREGGRGYAFEHTPRAVTKSHPGVLRAPVYQIAPSGWRRRLDVAGAAGETASIVT